MGLLIGRFTSPVKEKLIEKEVEKIVQVESPTAGLAKKYLFKFIDVQEEVSKLPYSFITSSKSESTKERYLELIKDYMD